MQYTEDIQLTAKYQRKALPLVDTFPYRFKYNEVKENRVFGDDDIGT